MARTVRLVVGILMYCVAVVVVVFSLESSIV